MYRDEYYSKTTVTDLARIFLSHEESKDLPDSESQIVAGDTVN